MNLNYGAIHIGKTSVLRSCGPAYIREVKSLLQHSGPSAFFDCLPDRERITEQDSTFHC